MSGGKAKAPARSSLGGEWTSGLCVMSAQRTDDSLSKMEGKTFEGKERS